jgi:uncharacterized membrane protein YfcA
MSIAICGRGIASSVDWLSVGILIFSATLGGLIRRLSGFGGALIMSPLLMRVFPVPFFIPIVMTTELLGGLWLSRQWKVSVQDKPRIYRMWLIAALALPLGIFLSELVVISTLKVISSTVIILFSVYLLARPHFKFELSKAGDITASSLAGLLLGSCGIGGPPVALYFNSSSMQFERARGLLSQFVSGICFFAIITASMMGGGLGWIQWLLLAIPVYFLGMYLGTRLLRWRDLSARAIKTICLYILIVNALFNLLIMAT